MVKIFWKQELFKWVSNVKLHQVLVTRITGLIYTVKGNAMYAFQNLVLNCSYYLLCKRSGRHHITWTCPFHASKDLDMVPDKSYTCKLRYYIEMSNMTDLLACTKLPQLFLASTELSVSCTPKSCCTRAVANYHPATITLLAQVNTFLGILLEG